MFQQIIPEQHDIIGEIVEVLEKGSMVPLIVRLSGFRCLMAFAQYQFRFGILEIFFYLKVIDSFIAALTKC